MNKAEWKYLLAGPSGEIHIPDNPTDWIDNTSWSEIYKNVAGAATLEAFTGMDEFFVKNIEQFKDYYDSSNPQEHVIFLIFLTFSLIFSYFSLFFVGIARIVE